MSGVYARVYEIVRRIPPGKVLTYGLISSMMGGRLSAQGVGWALKALASGTKADSKISGFTPHNVPWHRVINSQGSLSTYKNPEIPPGLQQELLEKEGVSFDGQAHLDLTRFLWKAGLAEHTLSADYSED